MDSPVGLTPLSVDTEADDAVRAADELLASMSQEDLQVLTEDIPVVDPDDVEDFALTKDQEILRFGSATTDQDLEDLEKEARPKNTMRNTHWGINVYDAWIIHAVHVHDNHDDVHCTHNMSLVIASRLRMLSSGLRHAV